MLLPSDPSDMETGKFIVAQSVLNQYIPAPGKPAPEKLDKLILEAAFRRASKALSEYFAPDIKNDIKPVLESLSLFFQSVELSTNFCFTKENLKEELFVYNINDIQKMLLSLITSYKLEDNRFTLELSDCELYEGFIFNNMEKKSVTLSFNMEATEYSAKDSTTKHEMQEKPVKEDISDSENEEEDNPLFKIDVEAAGKEHVPDSFASPPIEIVQPSQQAPSKVPELLSGGLSLMDSSGIEVLANRLGKSLSPSNEQDVGSLGSSADGPLDF